MILCLDAGNTRLKWAYGPAGQTLPWVDQGVCGYADLAALPRQALAGDRAEAVSLIRVANVAGPSIASTIQSVFTPWADRLTFVQTSVFAGGVNNRYEPPETLGVDRWCGLLGAWGLFGQAALVVSLGTATTVDALDHTGTFLGGLILPGLSLMQDSLAQGTAQLPYLPDIGKSESMEGWPIRTAEAIQAGVREATAGAIERAWQRLKGELLKEGMAARLPLCVLSGGAADSLVPFLQGTPVQASLRIQPGLVLLGLKSF